MKNLEPDPLRVLGTGQKSTRVYQRKFDHDEARRMRAQGRTYADIAVLMGVSSQAVLRVCNPAVYESVHQASLAWTRKQRRPCRGGCGALVWTNVHGRSGYCPVCHGREIRATTVRPDTLLCTRCGMWKPDEDFPFGGKKGRRLRHTYCRPCQTEARREYRWRSPENRERDASTARSAHYARRAKRSKA